MIPPISYSAITLGCLETEGIHYICEADLPKRISCDEMDLSVLLGNALENAVEGCKKAKTERDLRIKLRYEKEETDSRCSQQF